MNDGTGTLLRRWLFDPTTGQPVVQYEGTGTAATDRRYLSQDERGSIISVSDSTAAPLGINTYDEYGQPGALTGRFGYTGQAWLPEVTLWYYKARVYEPELGRFLQPDPIGYEDSANLYAYVLNDPVNLVDPLGLSCGGSSGPEPEPGAIVVTGQCPSAAAGLFSFMIFSYGTPTKLGGAPDRTPTEPLVPTVKAKETLKKIGRCALAQYGLGDGKTPPGFDLARALSELGATPLCKPWLGIAVPKGVSKFTNPISYIPHALGIRANLPMQVVKSGRVFGALGRLNAPVAAVMFAVDLASIATCASRK